MAEKSKVVFTKIRNMSKLLDVGTGNAVLALGIAGAGYAKLLAPVKDGMLRNSIQYITGTGKTGGLNDSEGDTASGILSAALRRYESAVGASASYATYVEYGTRFQAPQVFLRASLLLLAGVAASVVKKKMDDEFEMGVLKYGQQRTEF